MVRAETYRGRSLVTGHEYFTHGAGLSDARAKLAAGLPASIADELLVTECDPYWYFLSLANEVILLQIKGLWLKGRALQWSRDFNRVRADRPRGTRPAAVRKRLAMVLRLAMLLDWWAADGNERWPQKRLNAALRVHGGNVPQAAIQGCTQIGLEVPFRWLSIAEREALERLAAAYGRDGSRLTDGALVEIWESGDAGSGDGQV